MLTVLYRNVLQVISLVRRNSKCCDAQNVPFCSGMSTSKCNKSHLQMTENHNMLVSFKQRHILISEACALIVPFSHNSCLAEFCIYQTINCHNIHFLYSCLIYLYVVLNAETFSKNSYCWQCGNTKNYTISLITSFLFFSHLTVWHS